MESLTFIIGPDISFIRVLQRKTTHLVYLRAIARTNALVLSREPTLSYLTY